MNVAIDTSVVLRLLTGVPHAQAEAARLYLERCDAPVAIDALVVGESYFALRHHYQVPHREAVSAIIALLSSERIQAPAALRHALATARDDEEPGVMDRLILAAARLDDRALLTFDKRLARLEGAQLLR